MAIRRNSALVLLLAVTLAWGALYVHRTSFVVGDDRVFCLWDDAMISMTYARNLHRGDGLVWNRGGERVQGITNLGVTLVMAGLHGLPVVSTQRPAAFQLLTLALLIASVALVFRIANAHWRDPWLAFGSALATALCAPLAIWTLQGSDVGFVSLWLLLAVAALTPCARDRPWVLWLLALGPLIRLDVAVLYVAVAAVSALWAARPLHHLAHAGLALSLVVGGLLLFGQLYYGDPLPNTYYLKATGVPRDLALLNGLAQLGAWLPAALLPLVCSAVLIPRRDPLVALAASAFGAILAYHVWVGGDWVVGAGSRFVAPVLPLLALLAVGGARALLDRAAARLHVDPRTVGPTLIVASVAIGLCLTPPAAAREWLDPRTPTLFHAYNAKNYRFARYLRDFTSPETTVAVHWGGVVPYFSGRRAIDVLGKSDRHIARLTVDRFLPGHSKWDWDYVMRERRPEVIDIPSRGLESHPELLERYVLVHAASGLAFFMRRDALELLSDTGVVIKEPPWRAPVPPRP
jgi:hypothetical protein